MWRLELAIIWNRYERARLKALMDRAFREEEMARSHD